MRRHLVYITLFLLLLNSVFAISPTFNRSGGTPDVSGALAFWTFQSGSLIDYSGNNHVAENHGADLTTGIQDQAYDYVSSNSDFMNISSSTDFAFGDAISGIDKSITLWIKPDDATPSTEQSFLSKRLAGIPTQEWVFFLRTDGTIQFIMYDHDSGDTIRTQTTSAELSDGVWSHIVLAYDGTDERHGINMYIDGVLVPQTRSEVGIAFSRPRLTSTALLFGNQLGSSSHFDGTIDEIGFYALNFSQTEVDYFYNSGLGAKFNTTGGVVLPNATLIGGIQYNFTLNYSATNDSLVTANDTSAYIITDNATNTAQLQLTLNNGVKYQIIEYTLTNIEGSDSFSVTYKVDQMPFFNEHLENATLKANITYNWTLNWTATYPALITTNNSNVHVVTDNNSRIGNVTYNGELEGFDWTLWTLTNANGTDEMYTVFELTGPPIIPPAEEDTTACMGNEDCLDRLALGIGQGQYFSNIAPGMKAVMKALFFVLIMLITTLICISCIIKVLSSVVQRVKFNE
jgi:hypothetical protein